MTIFEKSVFKIKTKKFQRKRGEMRVNWGLSPRPGDAAPVGKTPPSF
jgi:hypothetical protein